ncbi:hypothetical protein K435DRAFT_74591 [Dendrothele bispora CBS 962.96]|uniref:Uncharacterized protein n=1 Tax=Dendrothele bispora (strain CBS 962.96) TaxID=1314807 RepID=A0A4S8KQ66_DENBC|nr:hypothetical protein K435DRAFT_74591 [Dendrothele bispora CBS 962.96]
MLPLHLAGCPVKSARNQIPTQSSQVQDPSSSSEKKQDRIESPANLNVSLSYLHHFSRTHLALHSPGPISQGRHRYQYNRSQQRHKYEWTTSPMEQQFNHHHHHHRNMNMGTHFGHPSLPLNSFAQHIGTRSGATTLSNRRSATASLDEDTSYEKQFVWRW